LKTSVAGYGQTGIRHIDCPIRGDHLKRLKNFSSKIEELMLKLPKSQRKSKMVAEQIALAEEMAKNIEGAFIRRLALIYAN
jgi:hypothetical protein